MSNAKITGTFVDFSELTHKDLYLLDWGEKEWAEELTDMKAAGIDTAIIARTMRFGSVYYYSDFFETHLERDWLTPFFKAAQAVGMRVFISGMISDHFFTADTENFTRMMKRDRSIYRTVIEELLDRFTDYNVIDGIYISHEADNDNLAEPSRRDAARDFFRGLYGDLKQTTDLPILSSPFYTRSYSPVELTRFWSDFLGDSDEPMFDILAMQDGVGCNRNIYPETVTDYYKPLVPVFSAHNITFWNNVETFSMNPGFRDSGFDRTKIWLKTAPIDRINRQYRAGIGFAEKTITWEYGHFFSRKQAGVDLYENFKKWNLDSVGA